MEEQTKKEIVEQFKTLPESLQSYIQSKNISEEVNVLLKNEVLNPNEKTSLENEAALVLLGFEHPDNLRENIQKRLELNPIQADRIAGVVDAKLFAPVKTDLLSLWKEEKGEEVEEKTAGGEEQKPEEKPQSKEKEEFDAVSNMLEQKMSGQSSGYTGGQDPYREPIEDNDTNL